jgi:glycosyltransferase involved in cell wall biosynthesis
VADDDEARELADDAKVFMAAHPHHRFEWLCNVAEETAKLRALGLSAHTHNQNIFIREDVFRPCRRVVAVHDAVYNARISPEKRNEHAADIASVAFIVYRDPGEHSPQAFHEACRTLARQVPGGRLLNRLTASGCARLSPARVNAAYAQAHVGLCLSPREGAMRVAIEYQMAGLPIVGTPCRGGRDHYLDPETWAIVPPDPRAVRGAVEALKAKALPREYVRARAMARIERDRKGFVSFVQDLIDAEGGRTPFDARFEKFLRKDRFERWLPMRDFAAEVWKAVGGD